MPHSFVICIDESGDQGFTFTGENLSSDWFVLSGVVTLSTGVQGMTDLVRRTKKEIGWGEKKALHFKDVKAGKRATVLQMTVADKALFRAIAILVHKPCLSNSETFANNRLYFYFTRFLLERASWLCRDSNEYSRKACGDGTAQVIFSNMNEISRDQIMTYFAHLQGIDTQIDWRIIRDDQFQSLSPGKHAGLQLADIVAGAFHCTDHCCERKRTARWAKALKPMMYRSRTGKLQAPATLPE